MRHVLMVVGLGALCWGALEHDEIKILVGILCYLQWQIEIIRDELRGRR